MENNSIKALATLTAITLLALTVLSLTGCKSEPKSYGDMIDWSVYDTEDSHVIYAQGDDGCYSDGSYTSNQMFDAWVKKYERNH